jgi:hypothetical protein
MIIFGTKARHKTIGTGQFYCPRCQTQRTYERKKAKRYFTLYFVPIIPMGDMGEFVVCQTCHTAFETAVLASKAPQHKMSLAEMLNSVKSLLDSGTPVEYMVRDLTAAGLDREIALKTIDGQIGATRKMCSHCGLTYTPTVDTSAECQNPLKADAEQP